MEVSDLGNRFRHHNPKTDSVAELHEAVKNMCLHLAIDLNDILPDSREKSLAITHLEEVSMWASKAIAINT